MWPVTIEFLYFVVTLVVTLGLALALVLLGVAIAWWAITRGYVEIQAVESTPPTISAQGILTLHEATADDRGMVQGQTRRTGDAR